MAGDRKSTSEALLQDALRCNPTLVAVLERAAGPDLPGWYLTAGCLCQTGWNVRSGRPADTGIRDYDLCYFDAGDLSWEAEDTVIRRGRQVFADLLDMVVRPNPRLAPRSVYQAKAERSRREWPGLTVLPWSPQPPPRVDAVRTG